MSASAPFLTARWVDLVMANFEVDPEILLELVPRGTELDLWNGRCLVSVVGFLFLDTRVRGVAVPMHRDFEEVNLRFYVRRETASELRRGVVFVKEIVPRRALAWVANALYGERYVTLPMSHVRPSASDPTVCYRWRFGAQDCLLSAKILGEAQVPDDSSEETFITEHYWGYARQRSGDTLEYRVEHPRWKVCATSDGRFECPVAQLYGERFGRYLSTPPSSCFVAQGSEILVRRGVVL